MPRPRSRAAPAAVAPIAAGPPCVKASAPPAPSPGAADAGALAALGWSGCAEAVAYGHNARVFDLAPAPPSSSLFAGWVASAAEDDAVRVWKPGREGFALAASFRGHADPVLRVAWHPAADTSRALASASGDRTARVWRLEERGDGRTAAVEVAAVAGHAEEVYSCEFLAAPPDAFRLLTASGPGLETWEVRPDGSSARLSTAPPCAVAAHAEGGGAAGAAPPTPDRWAAAHVFGVAVQQPEPASSSRPHIAAACSDGSLRLWAADTAASCALAPVFGVRAWARGVASSVAWSPDGAGVAITTTDGRAALFDVRRPATAVWRGSLGEGGGGAYSCAFVRPSTLAVGAAGGVALFDASADAPAPVGWLRPACTPPRRFLCVAAGGGDGRIYAAGEAVEDEGGGGEDGRAVLWSTAGAAAEPAAPGHDGKRSLWAPISVFCPAVE